MIKLINFYISSFSLIFSWDKVHGWLGDVILIQYGGLLKMAEKIEYKKYHKSLLMFFNTLRTPKIIISLIY